MSMQTPWDHRYAQRTQLVASSAIRELLKYTEKPDIISFAGGLPAPEVFPVEEFRVACDRVLRENGAQALQYSTTEGLLPLREMIARHSSRYGIEVTPDNVLITASSQQALDLLGKILINPGDNILIEMADRYGVPIIEDDPYGQLRYEGQHLPSVVVLDSQYRDDCAHTYRGNVIYLSTFSKLLAPGLRLGWVIAPAEVIRKLGVAKQAADLHTSTFTQMIAYEVSRGGFIDRHVPLIRVDYGS